MSFRFLDQVERGKKQRPYYLLMYGPDGVGKSTFAADAPAPLFMASESGTDRLDVARFPTPKSFKDMIAMVDELLADRGAYQTLVIDSLDWAEPLCHGDVIADAKKADITSIEDFGYGKGYVKALEKWQTLIQKLNLLREKMNVILIAHSQIRTFQDPQANQGYDRHELKLHAKAAALFREAVDAVLFTNFETFTKEIGSRVRAFGEGSRVFYTERRPAFDAKNRFGLPFHLPLSWDDFEKAARLGEPESEASITTSIEGLLENLQESDLKKAALETLAKFKGNVPKLIQLKDRLLTRLGDK